VQAGSVKTLAFIVMMFFFTSNLSRGFLPVYFKEAGLSTAQMVEILLFTFVVIGGLPIALLKIPEL
jgi:hypothetical protein